MSKIKNDAPGMKGERGRNNNGQLREKSLSAKVELLVGKDRFDICC
jgi:hypothetical protein